MLNGWDAEVFQREENQDFLVELDELDERARHSALIDACTLALDDPTDEELSVGYAAALIAAIWSGAPYSDSQTAAEFSFIRGGIGSCEDKLQEQAVKVLEIATDDPAISEAAEEFYEALS